jgi:hypothetical protein
MLNRALVIGTVLMTACTSRQIHVSVKGLDQAPGSAARPVRTLGRALMLARGGPNASTIWLGEGTHQVLETVVIGSEVSGTEEAPLTIRGVPGKTILSGGAEIPSSLFEPLADPLLRKRVPEVARQHVLIASLSQHPELHAFFTASPTEYKRQPYAMLTWQGYTLQQARWPNRGYAYMAKEAEKGPTTRWGWEAVPYGYDRPVGGRFAVRAEGLLPGEAPLDYAALETEFSRSHDMTISGYLSNDWYYQFEPVGRVHGKDKALQLLGPTRYGVGNPKMGLERRFFIANTLCHLDEPGEWYYDHGEQRLYLWSVQTPSDDAPVRIAGGPALLSGKGLKHVVLRDLVFENFGKEGVTLDSCDHVVVGGCEFRTGIGRGMSLRGTHNTITGCEFHDLVSAFALSGHGANRLALVPEHNAATNNHIHHCRRRGYGLLYIGGVGVHFANNLLHDQNGGIFYGDNDAILEYNEFYNMGYEMGDWNVAYNGADLTKVNNQFRFNFVHHLMETPRGYPVAAARSDDGGSGLRAIGNILYKCGRSGFEFHGPANDIRDNVLMETQHLWWTLQRPYKKVTREEYLADERALDQKNRGTHIKADVIGKAEKLLGKKFWKRDFVWTQRYPHLKGIFGLTNWEDNPWMQGYCRIENNYIWHGRSFPIHAHGHNKVETPAALRGILPTTATYEATRTFDPAQAFIDPAALDFRRRPDAELPGSFPEIDFARIGLHLDEYRTRMPDKATYRLAVAKKYQGVRSHGGSYDRVKINRRYPAPPYLGLVAK